MDGLSLLKEARQSGLHVSANDDLLIVKGPRRQVELAQRLLKHKLAVIAELAREADENSMATPAPEQEAKHEQVFSGRYCDAHARNILEPDDLPVGWRLEWEERSAIAEFDGHLPRELAEARALTDVISRMIRAGDLRT